jgi:arylformamidase
VTRIVDLSHPVGDGTAAYPGLPPMRITALLEREASRERYGGRAEFLLSGFEVAGNTGTYLDAPFHRFAEGADLASVALDRCVGLPGVVVGAGPSRPIDLGTAPVAGRAVLFRTGWSDRWGSEAYWHDSPFLPVETVDRLVADGATLVGIDAGNVDDTGDLSRPAHTRLLAAGVAIVENLRNLQALPDDGFAFSAAPIPIVAGATFPVRAFAELP